VRSKCKKEGEVFLQEEKFVRGYGGLGYGGRAMVDLVDCVLAMNNQGHNNRGVPLALAGPLSWAELVGKVIVQECEMRCRKGLAEPKAR
jgi:hypothetical protein